MILELSVRHRGSLPARRARRDRISAAPAPPALPRPGRTAGGPRPGTARRVLGARDQAEQEVVLVVLEQVEVEEEDVEPASTTSASSE
ncbi:hypothetical protein GCM10010417_26380 [Streptomyces carpaticus]